MGLRKSSNKLHVYDAGYIKLREASLTYNFSAETLENYLSLLLFQSLEEIYGLSIKTLRMQILKLV
jgi:Zn-dependent oligopeptidase